MCLGREQILCQGLFRVPGSLQALGLGLDCLVSSLGISASTGLTGIHPDWRGLARAGITLKAKSGLEAHHVWDALGSPGTDNGKQLLAYDPSPREGPQ